MSSRQPILLDGLMNSLAVAVCQFGRQPSMVFIDIRPMLWCEFCVARVSPRVHLGMRTSASCPSFGTIR